MSENAHNGGERPQFPPGMRSQFAPGMRPQFAPGERPQFAPGMRPQFAPGERPQFPPGMRPQFPPGQRPQFPPGTRPPFPPGGRPPFPPGDGKPGEMPLPPFVDLSLWEGVDNPYHWPLVVRTFGQKFNGYNIGMAPVKEKPMVRYEKLRKISMKEDDVILAAFPKCGTHWVSEIMGMLLKGSSTYNKKGKENTMLEFVKDIDNLADLPSPRVFNSHLYCAHLPEEVAEKKVKLVHVIRNPKDTAVSWFHHLKGFPMSSPEFNFDNFLKGYMTEDYCTFGHQFEYLRQLSEFQKANPDHPIIHIYYEDLKMNPIPIVKELAKFLGKEASDEFCKEVIEACGFKNLKKAEEDRTEAKGMAEMPTTIYRKGVVGDWKNSFTVAQNEAFDEFIKENQKKGFGDFKLNLWMKV